MRDSASIGRSSQRDGKAFEKAVGNFLETAQQVGMVSYCDHSQPGWIMQGKDRYVRAEASGADFHGVLRECKRAFTIECKTVAPGDRLNFKTNFMKLNKRTGQLELKRQVHHLDACGDLGFIAIEFRHVADVPTRFLIPWGSVPWVENRPGARTVGHAEMFARHPVGMSFERFRTLVDLTAFVRP